VNRVARISAMAAIAAVALTRCGTPHKSVILPTSPTTTPHVDPSAATREAVIAAYKGMWSDYQQDLATANWQNPLSVKHATGKALLVLENTLALDGHHGWIGKGTPELEPIIKTLTDHGTSSTAEIVDCADLTHFLLYVASTGALQDSTPGGRHLIDATLIVEDGVWKVSTFATGVVGSC
jgi:hypothetical protein